MRRPRRSVVRTPGFHPGNGGSIPLGVAINIVCIIQRVVISRPLFYWWMNRRYGLYWGIDNISSSIERKLLTKI